MAKNATLNARAFRKDLKKIDRYFKGKFADELLDEFKKNTPRDSGNAKRKTTKKVTNDKIMINTNYPYGEVLDDGLYPNPPKKGTGKTVNGYSTQAPSGMSTPTLSHARKLWNRFIRRL